jgi:hypothetical protein
MECTSSSRINSRCHAPLGHLPQVNYSNSLLPRFTSDIPLLKSVILALLVSSYNTSLVIGLSMVVISFVGCIECKAGKDLIPCHKCGTKIPGKDGVYTCSTLDAVLSGYSKPVLWLVFAAFQIGKAVEVMASLY